MIKVKKNRKLAIRHYAPDVTFTAADYELPFDIKAWILSTKKEMELFLDKTNPDVLCDTYFDQYIDRRADLYESLILNQRANHMEAISSICDKHESEILRLRLYINEVKEILEEYDQKIAAEEELYSRLNGREA